MQERSIVERIVIPERTVEAPDVRPGHLTALELQLMQLREEIRSELSAFREEVRGGDEETRRHVRLLHDTLIARLTAIGDGMNRRKR
jgi:hypothetical protein